MSSRWARLSLRAAGIVSLVVLVLFVLGPLIWLMLRGFANKWTYPSLLPDGWTLKWWRQVFADQDLAGSIKLSLTFAPVVTIVSALLCLPAAYGFARYEFPGRRTLLISLFATNAFPKTGLYVSIAALYYTLHLMGTFVGVVIIQLLGTVVFMTWIPAAAFAAVPRSLEEAARDVGAGRIRVFLQVTLPIVAPAILVAMILAFLESFDESQGTFMVGAPDYITMPSEMYTLVINYPEQAAAVFAILLTIPSVLLIALARKHIMGGRLAEGFQLR
jgi:putative spermidine/putrescine transport system permease protein